MMQMRSPFEACVRCMLGVFLGFTFNPKDAESAEVRLIEVVRHWSEDSPREVEVSAVIPGETLVVEVTGLQPGGRYTLETQSNAGSVELRSHVSFFADSQGRFRTDRDPAVEGSYVGVEPTGPFDGLREHARTNTESPRQYLFRILANDLEVGVRAVPFRERREGVREISLSGTGLVGKLFLPPTQLGRRPILISFSGSDGGYTSSAMEASWAANNGIAGLALAYFGIEGVDKNLANVKIDDLFRRALAFLQTVPDVDSSVIIANGVSRGSELVGHLAALFPEIKASILRVPSAYTWQSFPVDGESPFTIGDFPVPFLSWPYVYTETEIDGESVNIRINSFYDALRMHSQEDKERARNPIERALGPVLFIGGTSDTLWPSGEWGAELHSRMVANGNSHAERSRLVVIDGAGHSVARVPDHYSPEITVHKVTGRKIFVGGDRGTNNVGMRTGRAAMLSFIREVEAFHGIQKPSRSAWPTVLPEKRDLCGSWLIPVLRKLRLLPRNG